MILPLIPILLFPDRNGKDRPAKEKKVYRPYSPWYGPHQKWKHPTIYHPHCVLSHKRFKKIIAKRKQLT